MKKIKDIEKAQLIMTLRSMGILSNKVLSVMEKIPRELFIPRHLIHYAYENSPLPIGYNQTISQPYVVALMTEKLNLQSSDIVLEIGTGSGYQTAILSKLARKIYTIERIKPLLVNAKRCFSELKLTNIVSMCADGHTGWKEMSPFDKIIVTCSTADFTPDLLSQIRVGGKFIVPMGELTGKQILKCITISNDKCKHLIENVCEVSFVPMIKDN